MLAAATEINALRDQVALLSRHSLALNQICFALATLLGDTDGQQQIETIPMDLVRRVTAWIELLEDRIKELDA